jgi:hypothetical protein
LKDFLITSGWSMKLMILTPWHLGQGGGSVASDFSDKVGPALLKIRRYWRRTDLDEPWFSSNVRFLLGFEDPW